MKSQTSTTKPRAAVPHDPLRADILGKLKHRLTPSELHHRLGGRYSVMDIEAELIAMDLDGVVINDLVPQSRITQKGRKARAKAFFTTEDTEEHEGITCPLCGSPMTRVTGLPSSFVGEHYECKPCAKEASKAANA